MAQGKVPPCPPPHLLLLLLAHSNHHQNISFDSAVTHLRQLVKAGLNCLYGMQQYINSSPSSLMVIVDLGEDPRYISTPASSSMLCPFHSKGVYFVIESYLFPSEQFMQQHLQQTGKDKASIPVDPSLLLRCSRRRHNRFGGVLGEGGHFEHPVEAYRDHFQDVGSPTNPAAASVLCAELGIPFVVTLHAESGNKLTLQYCSGGGGSDRLHRRCL